MKVLHLEFGRNLYGGALQVAYLLRGLSKLGEVESHLGCDCRAALISEIGQISGVSIHPLKIRGELDFSVYFQLRRLVRKLQPDLLHLHSRRGADFWGVAVARRLRLPYILTRRVDNPDSHGLTHWRTCRADAVVGISGRICEVMRESGVSADKLHCILSAVDTDRFHPSGDRAMLERAAGINPDQPAVGIIAQLIERKGHRSLFQAIPGILESHPRVCFLVFGKGPLRQSLEKEAATQGWHRSLRFMGFRDDLPQLLPALDVVAHPAYMEGLGVSLLQAAAAAVPIVASRAGGIPEIVRHNENGFLIEPGDVNALQAGICRLLANPGLRSSMGRKSREIALREFSIPRMAAAYRDLYESVNDSAGA